jgi:hemolysin III
MEESQPIAAGAVGMMSRFREPVSGFTHLFAAGLSLLGLIWLVDLTRHDPARLLTMLIYGASMVTLFAASAIYHLAKGSPRTLNLLVRIDLIGIFLLIAGTYTPLCAYFLDGLGRVAMLGAVWTMAALGCLYVALIHRRRKLSLALTGYFVAMGSVGVIGAPYFASVMPPGAVLLILAGGATYLAGTVVFAIDRPNLHRHFSAHDLWHLFVMGGSAFFFTAILLYVALA